MAKTGKEKPMHPSSERDGGFAKLPSSVIEIESGFVLGARLMSAPKRGLRRLAVTGLDAGVVEPSPSQMNVAKPEMLSQAIKVVSDAIGSGGGRTALLLPDAAVRVNILDFETLPSKKKEMEALVRWKIKDSLGFAVEEARISYQKARRAPGKIELLVIAVKKDVLAQYEAVIEDERGGPAVVLPATFTLLALLPETDPGVQLLIHVCSGWVTHALVEGERLRFWRSRQLAQNSGTTEVVSEAARAAASARDRMGLEIARAWLCSRPLLGDGLRDALQKTLNVAVEDLPLDRTFEAGLGAEEKPLYGLFAAPLAGMILNSGRAS
ncbi:MAG: hypothetical protein ACRD2G_10845 [Terriglobia bacterium]